MPIKVTPINPVTRTSVLIDKNGEYDVTLYSTARVNVPQTVTKSPLNIAYGNTPPKDTGALWIKGSKPKKLMLGPKFDYDMVANEMYNRIAGGGVSHFGCVAIKKDIYIIGGSSGETNDTIVKFNVESGESKILDVKLPYPLACIGCAAIGDKIYIFGGYTRGADMITVIKNIYVLDTKTEKITVHPAKLPHCMYDVAAVAVNGVIYLCGGMGSGYDIYSDIHVFDPSDMTSNAIRPFCDKNGTPITFECGCRSLSPAVIDNDIYFVGGWFDNVGRSNKIRKLNTKTGVLETCKTSMSVFVDYASVAAVDGKIYVFGGDDSAWLTGSTFAYDPVEDRFFDTFGSMKLKLFAAGCVCIDGVIYIVGGASRSIRFEYVHKFTIKGTLEYNTIYVDISGTGNNYTIMSDEDTVFEIGIDRVYRGNERGYADIAEAYLHNGEEWKLIV